MCGIAGLIQNQSEPLRGQDLKKAVDLMDYRGPDDQGFCFWGLDEASQAFPSSTSFFPSLGPHRIGLGHRRLSILDLSDHGRQPMSYGDGRYWISFNGEIYNYLELRTELESQSYQFKTQTDTEVILAAYDCWGEACLEKFNGMWAFAILDTHSRRLFLSRDRYGIKPLYFSYTNKAFGFASEIKVLRAMGFGSGRAQRETVAQFISFGSVNVFRETCFEEIFQLLPGEQLSWSLDQGHGKWQTSKYYELSHPYNVRSQEPNHEDWFEEYQYLFRDSVKLRLRSDVEVGSCLSGGMDSSSIVLTVRDLQKDISQKTFTSCFTDKRFDEWEYAKSVIDSTGAESFQVFPDLLELQHKDLQNLCWHQEEPFISTSVYAQWKVMEKAKQQGIKVLLDGQGADETLGGYHKYLSPYFSSLLRMGDISQYLRSFKEMRRTGFLGVTEPAWRVVLKSLYHASSLPKPDRLGLQKCLQEKAWRKPWLKAPPERQFTELLRWDTQMNLQSLLRHEDRNSMAHSIEARTPFLDYRLVEHVIKSPMRWRFQGGWSKAPLREAMKGLMPERVRQRVDKKGFVTPESTWLGQNEKEMRSQLMHKDNKIHEWLEPKKLQAWLDEKPLSDRQGDVWRLLMIDQWMKTFDLA